MSSSNENNRRQACIVELTPKFYKWADIATEAFIYFTILWGPWAFANVHNWAILIMNLANYCIGILLLTKWAIRYKTGYKPARWTSQNLVIGPYYFQKINWRVKVAVALTAYLLVYVLIAVINVRATYSHDFNHFDYENNFIKWLPHSYHRPGSIQSFFNFLGLACCFWGIRDWLLGIPHNKKGVTKKQFQQNSIIKNELEIYMLPERLKRILWFICINAGLLAFIGIIQRLDGTSKLLWIYESNLIGQNDQSFGAFGYRSNAASYLNMILPISIGLYFISMHNVFAQRLQRGQNIGDYHLALLPPIFLIIVASFITLSRGGFLVMVTIFLLGIMLLRIKLKFFTKNKVPILTGLLLGGICLGYIFGSNGLFERLKTQNSWHVTNIKQENRSNNITYNCELPAPPYDRESYLFFLTNSRNGKFRKSYLKTVLNKDGTLKIELYSDIAKSQISTTFTNIIEHLKTRTLYLEVDRGVEGLVVQANGKTLEGFEEKSGPLPPNWDHPIIPKYVYVNRKAILKSGMPELETKFLEITQKAGIKSKAKKTGEAIKIDFTKYFDPLYITSLSSDRFQIYQACLNMSRDFWLLGCGPGAWSSVYFLYHEAGLKWQFWAHSDLLEYLITFGVLGLIPGLLLVIIIVFPKKCQSVPMNNGWLCISLNLAITGCFIHSLFDFPLQVISIMHLFVILCSIKMVTFERLY